MLSKNTNQIYLAIGTTDLRKSIDGLSILVKKSFELDPFSRSLFVFCNRKKDKIKILEWDLIQAQQIEELTIKLKFFPSFNLM